MRYAFTIRNLLFVFLFLLTKESRSQSSVLGSGQWYKVAIGKNGVYRISFDDFKKMGFDASSIDPRKIKIYGNKGGMLPQANSVTRPADLTENAIFVQGESDGVFNSGDYILWYAEGADHVQYDVQRGIFQYEHNLYSDKNYYFVTVGTDNGKRVANIPSQGGSFPVIETFQDYFFHEVDSYNELESGREWFERLSLDQQTYSTDIAGIVENSPIKLVSDVMGQSTKASTFQVYINNVLIAEQAVAYITDSQYSIKGFHKRDTIISNAATTGAAATTKQEIKYIYTKTTSGMGYLDFFLLNVQRRLSLYGDQTIFRSGESVNNSTSTFQVSNVTDNSTIWDITDPYTPGIQQYNLQNGMAIFSTGTSSLREFVVFNSNVPSPELVGAVANQNLHGLSTPNLIIVANPDFKQEAARLAAHRADHSGWSCTVVTPQEIYNEFSSGRQDVSAIRDFVKHLYDKSSSTLKALLLVGKSSYDYKDRVTHNTNFVATYESRNSLTPLETYSSDDYFGFLENSEGNWGESPVESNSLEIGVGRLPVKTAEEATHVVDKIIAYDTHKDLFGAWRENIVFVADDGSNSDSYTSAHQSQANTLANDIEATQSGFNTRKYFLGTYTKTVRPSGESIPEATADILSNFNRGALIMNYTGHGNEQVWADEQVFTNLNIEALENVRYPFLVTATCEFGRQDNPGQISSAELSVLQPHGGAIGLVTTARPVYSFTNFELNQAFYNALFTKESNHYISIGEVFRKTKNNSNSGVGNRNFSLIGDPSLTLALPSLEVNITSIQTASGSDTLKALSRAIIKGEVVDGSGTRLENFNGTLSSTLFDKQTDFITIGKNNPAFSFKQWYNILFRGKASVNSGAFEFQFIVPKNMAYEIGAGKISVYASDSTQALDAAGTTSSFKIGGSEKNPATDTTPPTIALYMGDTTFINGGIVSPNTTLVARLRDASGINVSGYGIGNTLTAVLDNDNEVYILSDYYEADIDDYTKGWVNFPISGLTPGKHTLTVKAWDTYNNPAQAQIDFVVTNGDALVIETFANYPNPFLGETTLYFTHNRAGDNLEAELFIYSTTGQQLKNYTFSIAESPYRVDLLTFDGTTDAGKKLMPGLYLARVAVRSLTNGSKNERLTKLIVVN
ncbi:MAG TPA: type IX secretion system sortase PorU [Ohtaekwangia sp.]|uniref:type IX secretion system sortase PorU n=1 Tax=Ohtaekwangia sp. TaxID=2066019 RepID=UPI002F9520A2